MRMKSIEELEKELVRKQELYDRSDNNPELQNKLQGEISKIIYQLRLWDELYNAVGEDRPTFTI